MDPIHSKTEGTDGTQTVRLEITWSSILRVLTAVLLAYVAVLLWPILKLLLSALLLAVALYPVVAWGSRKGWPRWLGLLLATAILIAVVVGLFAVIAPMVFRQMAALGESLPKLREQIIAQLPPQGVLHYTLQHSMSASALADSRLILERILVLVETTLGGLVHFIVVIALAVYLMVDGPRALNWLVVFFPAVKREKIAQTLDQISQLIFSFVAGQLLVSALAAIFMVLLLNFLGVPMALLLGIVAGLCDILPIIGFFVAVVLAMGIGLTVSPTTALLIFVCYGAYHLFENFVIAPRVYGEKLRLSKLAVPLAVAAGALVAGVVGAIVALPLVAAYPVLERLWLAPKLEPDTVTEHEAEASRSARRHHRNPPASTPPAGSPGI